MSAHTNIARNVNKFLDVIVPKYGSFDTFLEIMTLRHDSSKTKPYMTRSQSVEYENIKMREALKYLRRHPDFMEQHMVISPEYREKGFMPKSRDIFYLANTDDEMSYIKRNMAAEFLYNHYYDLVYPFVIQNPRIFGNFTFDPY